MPFYIFGLWILFRKKLLSDLKFFILTFLFISAIPAAVTRDPYSTLRSLPLVIPQIIIIALGIENIYPFIKNRGWKAISVIFFIVAVGYSILKFYSSAFILNDFYRARYWSWGWREVSEVINNLNTQNPIVVDNSRADPELLLAFFLKYNPENYQKENTEIPINEYYTNLYRNREKHVGLAITRPINWQNDLTVDQYLIGDELAISYEQIKVHNLTLVKEIFYPDETVAFRIVKTNPIWEQLQRKGKTPVLPKGTE